MPVHRWYFTASRWSILPLLMSLAGCRSTPDAAGPRSVAAQTRRTAAMTTAKLAEETGQARLAADQAPTRLVKPADTQPAVTPEVVFEQIPDPAGITARISQEFDRELADILATVDKIDVLSAQEKKERKATIQARHEQRRRQILERYESVHRPKRIELTLTDAIRRTMKNSYYIQTYAYTPAIEAARIVEAEAQFDAVFYTKFTNDKQDRPSSSELASTESQSRVWETGIRKLLPTGMMVRTAYQLSRSQTNLVFQTLNPAYFNSLIVEFAQPLLRGFGLDFNRSKIETYKVDRRIGTERLRREIRESVYRVEQAYWQLLQTRRLMAITARLLSDLETIQYALQLRADVEYDVYAIQLDMTKSRLAQHQADFIRLCNEVRNTEDTLKALMNDAEINLSQDIEIVPVDAPGLEAVMIDQLGEVAAALENRSELREARLAIEKTQIAIGAAKNQALPKLDLIFRYMIDGLGGNADRAFSQLSENDYNEYLISIEFEWPIGNRGPEAVLRQARLQQAQAIVAHAAQIESVILDVQKAVRDLQSNYDQISPQVRSAQAYLDQLRTTQARQIKRDPSNLQIELDAHEMLASSREKLLQVVLNYNLAMSNLERQKGTLLDYYNIVIRDADDDARMLPVQAVGP